MSTQFYTQDQPVTSQPGTRRAARPHRGGPSWSASPRHHRRRRRGRPDRAGHLGPDRQQPRPGPGPPGHRLPARQPGRQPGPADDPGRPPVGGIMGPQTIAAVKDLQRQAGLPQTGTMTPATQAALARYLAHGNNQMAG
jgi:peptidoglycan hydrolase-like protein with peptidoglycan-binding domain